MKTPHMLAYFIKSSAPVIMLFFSFIVFSQNSDETKVADTLIYKQKYGLRLGADLSKVIRTFIDDNYTGFEIMGDYRLTKNLYLAGELGTEERSIDTENVLTNTTSGSYFKAGIDLNTYRNWLDMENMIYFGFRVGASSFSQTLENFTIYDFNNQYFDTPFTDDNNQEFDGLTAFWGEVILGIKAEVLNNLFIGLNFQLKYLVSETELDNFENLYIPGFNRTYDSGRIGVGYGLNVAYLVPIFKKDKVVVQEAEEE